MITKLNPSSE